MKPIIKSIEINAPREKIWHVLWDDASYRDWCSLFSEGSYYDGTLALGEKVRFLGPNPVDGSIGWLLTEVTEFVPHEVMVFSFLWMVNNGIDVTEGPGVDEWIGLREQYHLTETDGVTTLAIDTVMADDYHEFMMDAWDKALARVKELSE